MNKKPMRKYKHKKQIKSHRLRHVFKDKHGHILEKVSTRPNHYVGLKIRPYFFCPKCDKFYREKLEKVILIG